MMSSRKPPMGTYGRPTMSSAGAKVPGATMGNAGRNPIAKQRRREARAARKANRPKNLMQHY